MMTHLRRNYCYTLLFLLAVCLSFTACVPEGIELPSRVKSIATDVATFVTSNGAKLCGVVSVYDTDTISCGIIYDTLSTLSSASGTMKPATANGKYSVTIDGLSANTTYHYRAYAIDAGVYKYGEVLSFKTDISVVTGNATDILDRMVTLHGEVDCGGNEPLACGFVYGTSSAKLLSNGKRVATTSSGKFSVSVSDLKPISTYYYCAYAIIDGRYVYGEVSSFVSGVEISAITGEASNIMGYEATITCTLQGAEEDATCGIIYGKTTELSSTSGTKITSIVSNNTYSVSIDKLEENTTYYYCAYVVVNDEYRYGEIRSFLTSDVAVTTSSATSITRNGATLGGTMGGFTSAVSCGIIYGKTSDLSATNGEKKSTTSKDSFTFHVSGLESSTQYYYRAYVVINDEYYYGNVKSFQTLEVTSTTLGKSGVSCTSATLWGGITNFDNDVSYGFIYGLTSSLSSSDGTKVYSSNKIVNEEYNLTITSLSPNITYYFRAFAYTGEGYIYGAVHNFTTSNQEIVSNPKTYSVNGVSFNMIEVEGGTFIMGSPKSDSDASDNEKPTHQVTVSDYYIGETEVTQALWQAVMGSNPSNFTGDLQRPVECVSWNDCQTFISKLNELTGESFRLPTEAEWEYAARGGINNNGYKYSGSDRIEDVAWYDSNSSNTTHAVKTKQPNQLGIYDMTGNVEEWCSDRYGSYSSSAQADPTGPSSGAYRVIRGGDLSKKAKYCRLARRLYNFPGSEGKYNGLRLAISFTESDDDSKQEPTITITTSEATDITSDGATLSGVISGATNKISCGIIYGTSSDMSSLNNKRISTSSNGTYSIDVSYLQPSTTYYYCAYATIDGEEQYGEILSLTTKQAVIVTTGEATGITSESAALSGVVSGATNEISCGIIYGASSDMSSLNNKRVSTSSNGTYSIDVSYLQPGTTYYYCAYATIDGEERLGEVRSFTTVSVTITTGEAAGITSDGVTLSGVVSGATNEISCGIIYGTSSNMSSLNNKRVGTSSNGTYSINVSYLQPSTTYYYCAYAIINGEEKLGEVLSFTTEQEVVSSPEAIDLGLSVKWASFNVGANSPEEYGGYFAWGETEEKSDYSWSTYKWCNGSSDSQTKYCTSSSYGMVDNKTTLDPEDDVAHVKWGGNWRMPTKREIEELVNSCSSEWVEVNGVKGVRFTGPNGNSIFFPPTGSLEGTKNELLYIYGYYWSSDLGYEMSDYYSSNANAFLLSVQYYPSTPVDWDRWAHRTDWSRFMGHSVRPVTE